MSQAKKDIYELSRELGPMIHREMVRNGNDPSAYVLILVTEDGFSIAERTADGKVVAMLREIADMIERGPVRHETRSMINHELN